MQVKLIETVDGLGSFHRRDELIDIMGQSGVDLPLQVPCTCKCHSAFSSP